jgi:hypothetical protein
MPTTLQEQKVSRWIDTHQALISQAERWLESQGLPSVVRAWSGDVPHNLPVVLVRFLESLGLKGDAVAVYLSKESGRVN